MSDKLNPFGEQYHKLKGDDDSLYITDTLKENKLTYDVPKHLYGSESSKELSEAIQLLADTGTGDVEEGLFEKAGRELGKLVDDKQLAYGDSITKTNELLKVFLSGYKNNDGTYTIPGKLLEHIGLMIRIMDKQNRIFSNPDGDLMDESPYSDLSGYGLLGSKLIK